MENDILPQRVGKKRVHFNIYDKMNVSRSIMVSDRIRGAATHSWPGEPEKTGGRVCMRSVLGGLHHHY